MSLFALAVPAVATVATAGSDDSKTAKPKASSFAPHHGGKHAYGAPIQHPILHKRHKTSHKTRKSDAAPGPPAESGVR
ncbi:MAG TPA: hypothetical protein VKQ31_08870 [Steroidobacteraceae bacterium]|nr:hypothetical protein [Steroidobacteraceae bacterium]